MSIKLYKKEISITLPMTVTQMTFFETIWSI